MAEEAAALSRPHASPNGTTSRRAVLRLAAGGTLALFPSPPILARSSDPARGTEFATRTEELITALDRFLNSYNLAERDGDWGAHANLLLFPHVRMSRGAVSVLDVSDRASSAALRLGSEIRAAGYGDAFWNFRDIVQAGSERAHVATALSWIMADGSVAAAYGYLFILERADNDWKVRGTSSYSR